MATRPSSCARPTLIFVPPFTDFSKELDMDIFALGGFCLDMRGPVDQLYSDRAVFTLFEAHRCRVMCSAFNV